MSALRLGSWAAGVVAAIGAAYIVTLSFAVARFGWDRPITDPPLAIMEVLTLFSAPPLVIVMAAILEYASADRKIFGVVALAFTVLFAGITSTVHFVELTASRQLEASGIAWPSTAYAAELLAWDWFLGLALMFAAPVFLGTGAEQAVRRALWISGALAFAGTVGPVLGDMRLQRIGILGYAVVLPVAFFMLARLFRAKSHVPPRVTSSAR